MTKKSSITPPQELPDTSSSVKAGIVRDEVYASWKFALFGGVVGSAVFGLSWAIREFIIAPLTCRSADAFVMCSGAGALAFNIATVLGIVIGTIVLVKLLAFRPLLVAIAAAISLWGLQAQIGGLSWYEALVWTAGLYTAAYWLYSWASRLYSFIGAFVLCVSLVIVVRFVLSA